MATKSMYTVMMQCRDGTRHLLYNPLRWEDRMHTITVSKHLTLDEAWREVYRLQPRGFNREHISLWVE
jgi:hypothetical protein